MNTDPHRLPQYLKCDNARMRCVVRLTFADLSGRDASGCYGHIVMGRVAAASRCGVWGSATAEPADCGAAAQKLAAHIPGSRWDAAA